MPANFKAIREGIPADRSVWKVGQLAKQTGLSVRTLHFYDEIGLLKPSQHSDSGHRLYTEADIARLQQILSLRQLGFSLEEIMDCLQSPDFSPVEVVRLHIERLREQIDVHTQLCRRLEKIADQLQERRHISAEHFILAIEGIRMSEKYPFTPGQMEKIKKQGELLGPGKMREVEQEWPELIAKVREAMEKGTPPDSPEVQQLGKRWKELIEMFTGGDPAIAETLKRRYEEEPGYAAQMGLNPEIFAYIAKAMPKD
ncbi:MerR family transcriptional regulator [Effusibacillus consociatus]|uniref:MerR family transcriptional regulator n=1 Tax=Effusibacillus consociatus TaxID=1117041 RepID=A0ABV9Q2C0_9BACL